MKAPLILIPWYGPWPDYFPPFLDGCRRNPEFEVLFFSDTPPPEKHPASVSFVNISLERFAKLISSAAGTEVRVSRPYKLCDFKPVYGLALKEWIGDREFWGFGDIDVIWGNLKKFASEKVLAGVDIFCVRKEYVSGAFTLIRNNAVMNAMFMRSPDWRRVFTEPNYFGFDECATQWHELIFGARYDELNSPICSFSEVVFRALEHGEIRGYFETVALEDGHSRVDVSERGVFEYFVGYALFHFVIVKRRAAFVYPKWSQVPLRYHLTRRGFLLANGDGVWKQLTSIRYFAIASKLSQKLKRLGRRSISRLLQKS